MKNLINILKKHGINSVIIGNKLFAKSVVNFNTLFFYEYEEVDSSNIYTYLGY